MYIHTYIHTYIYIYTPHQRIYVALFSLLFAYKYKSQLFATWALHLSYVFLWVDKAKFIGETRNLIMQYGYILVHVANTYL